MTSDPAYDWDVYDAAERRARWNWAKSHVCEQCEDFEPPPEGSWGWCRYFEDFEKLDRPCTRCERWND